MQRLPHKPMPYLLIASTLLTGCIANNSTDVSSIQISAASSTEASSSSLVASSLSSDSPASGSLSSSSLNASSSSAIVQSSSSEASSIEAASSSSSQIGFLVERDLVPIPIINVESEDYFRAYDLDSENTGTCKTPGAVDMVRAQGGTAGFCDVTDLKAGEWLEYKVDVPFSADYSLLINIDNFTEEDQQAEVFIDGESLSIFTFPPGFGRGGNFKYLAPSPLKGGTRIIRVEMLTDGSIFNTMFFSTENIEDPEIISFSITDRIQGYALDGLTDIAVDDSITLDIDDLESDEIALRINFLGRNIDDIIFDLNGMNEYATAEGFSPYFKKLVLGENRITATPRYATGLGTPANITLNIVDSRLAVEDTSTDVIALVGGVGQAEIIVSNTGNKDVDISLKQVPDWLSIDNTTLTVAGGSERTLTLSTPVCDAALTRTATLLLESINGDNDTIPLLVRQACHPTTEFDFALDRVLINQAVPSYDTDKEENQQIPLVKNRDGLLRVFATANQPNNTQINAVFIYRLPDGTEGEINLDAPTSIPVNKTSEGELSNSYNVRIPGEIFQPGTHYAVMLDSNNTVTEANEENNRYPASGFIELPIIEVPPIDITFIPVTTQGRMPSQAELESDFLLQDTKALFPVSDYRINLRTQPFTYTGDDQGFISWSDALVKLQMLHSMEGAAERHYLGIVDRQFNGFESLAGLAYPNEPVALSIPNPDVVAHEIGHTFSLNHVICNGREKGIDRAYPFDAGDIGIWGYNLNSNTLVPPSSKDFMTYCEDEWISTYHYKKIMDFRGELLTETVMAKPLIDTTAIPAERHTKQTAEQTIKPKTEWITGRIKYDQTVPQVEFTTSFTAPTTAPAIPGDWKLYAYDDKGNLIGEVYFTPEKAAHSTVHTFMVPLPQQQEIQRIEIRHQDALVFAMPWSTERTRVEASDVRYQVKRISEQEVHLVWPTSSGANVVVRDAASGQVLAIDQTGNANIHARSNHLELTYSNRGITNTTYLNVP